MQLDVRDTKVCQRPGSNRRPSACKADVMTTTLRRRRADRTTKQVYVFSLACCTDDSSSLVLLLSADLDIIVLTTVDMR